MYRMVASVTFGIFIFVAVFGLPMLLSHSENHVGCPLQSAQTVMCENTLLEHVSMWQGMFASIATSLVIFLGAALFILVQRGGMLISHERLRLSLYTQVSPRPTLLQELFSRGILNRKEPYAFS